MKFYLNHSYSKLHYLIQMTLQYNCFIFNDFHNDINNDITYLLQVFIYKIYKNICLTILIIANLWANQVKITDPDCYGSGQRLILMGLAWPNATVLQHE